MFIAEGRKVVSELLKSPCETAALLCLEEKERAWKPLAARYLSGSRGTGKLYLLDGGEWKRLSQDRESEGVMALARIGPRPSWRDLLCQDEGDILLLDRINNPNNLGAILRTAHWFGFKTVFLSAAAVDWTHPKVARSSMGSLFHLNIAAAVDFAVALPEVSRRRLLVGGDVRRGVNPHPTARRAALLLGSETHGLPEDLLAWVAERWHIPGAGGAESLSLPQAAAIMMYEIGRERGK
ncbi:MAG: RNA methyltransferase [Pseudomonadota bacterium]|nr:RNA methyltransferase [Pseudomonadota bacterium]